MSTLNPPQRVSRRQELREDQLTTLAAKSWDAFDRNKTIVYGVLGAITLVLAGIIGYYLYINSIEDDAQAALAASLKLYEQGDFRGALDGTADVIGLLDVADDFGSTDAGNLAHYYAADAHFRLGEYEQALDHFDDFSKSDNLIGASAHAGEAAVYEQQGDFSRAGDLYMRAALLFESDVTSPDYLLKAGRAYEKGAAYGDARDAYETLQDRFGDTPPAQQVELHLARVAAMQ